MSHFSDEDWVDLVRGLLPKEAETMQHHLAQGCSECQQVRVMWTTVLGTLSRTVQLQPAEADVRVVKAAFREQMRKLVTPKRSILAALTFDSFRLPAPGGFRNISLQARHLVHHADPWIVALRLKVEAGNRMFTAGHVTKSGTSFSEDNTLQITLAHAGTCLAQATTNAVGAFYLQSTHERGIQVQVWISADEPIVIPVADPEGNVTD